MEADHRRAPEDKLADSLSDLREAAFGVAHLQRIGTSYASRDQDKPDGEAGDLDDDGSGLGGLPTVKQGLLDELGAIVAEVDGLALRSHKALMTYQEGIDRLGLTAAKHDAGQKKKRGRGRPKTTVSQRRRALIERLRPEGDG